MWIGEDVRDAHHAHVEPERREHLTPFAMMSIRERLLPPNHHAIEQAREFEAKSRFGRDVLQDEYAAWRKEVPKAFEERELIVLRESWATAGSRSSAWCSSAC